MKLEVSYLSELFEDEVLEEVSTDNLIAAANYIVEEIDRNPEQRILDGDEIEASIIDCRISALDLFQTLRSAEANFKRRNDYFTWQYGCWGDFEAMDEFDARGYAAEIVQSYGNAADTINGPEYHFPEVMKKLEIEYEIIDDEEEG